jgi:hypothetical protein
MASTVEFKPDTYESDEEGGYVQTSNEAHPDGNAKRVHFGQTFEHPFESLPPEVHTEENAHKLIALIRERYPSAEIVDESHLLPGPYYAPEVTVEFTLDTRPGESWQEISERLADDPAFTRFRNEALIMWTFRSAFLDSIGLDPLDHPAPNQPGYVDHSHGQARGSINPGA